MRNYWHYRNSVLGPTFDNLKSSRWDCPFIIRLGFNGSCTVYDTRLYSNMKRIDFNYFSYSVVSTHLTTTQAKRKVSQLMKTED
jgi:hypothetical protein